MSPHNRGFGNTEILLAIAGASLYLVFAFGEIASGLSKGPISSYAIFVLVARVGWPIPTVLLASYLLFRRQHTTPQERSWQAFKESLISVMIVATMATIGLGILWGLWSLVRTVFFS